MSYAKRATMKVFSPFSISFFLLVSVFACKEPEVNIDTVEYQNEEIKVYHALIDELLDSVGFSSANEGKLVFYLGDTLAGEATWKGEEEFVRTTLATRPLAIADLAANSQHKFVRATDTLRLEPGDRFTSRWLRLSRVRFNTDRSMGFLSIGVYCGNLCSWTDSFYIAKKSGQWKIARVIRGPSA